MEVVEQLGITLVSYHGMVDHTLTESGQSRAGLQPEATTKATDTSMKRYIRILHSYSDLIVLDLVN